MAKRAYDTTPLTHAETRMCGHLTTVCEVAKGAAVHWCAKCERFSDETPCHRCNDCAECVQLTEEWRARMAAKALSKCWEQLEMWRAA